MQPTVRWTHSGALQVTCSSLYYSKFPPKTGTVNIKADCIHSGLLKSLRLNLVTVNFSLELAKSLSLTQSDIDVCCCLEILILSTVKDARDNVQKKLFSLFGAVSIAM